MATSRRAIADTQENVVAKIKGKLNIGQSNAVTKRPPLGDLGNTLSKIQSQNVTLKDKKLLGITSDNTIKQNGVKVTKPLTKRPPLLRNDTKKIEPIKSKITQKPILKREESIDRPPTPVISDPDIDVKDDPQMVAEYLVDIFTNMRETETYFLVSSDYLEGHESTAKMRAILANWLVEVNANFGFDLETLFLSLNIVDRYLERNKKIGRSTLQLVGTAAMFIACKYEQIHIPEIDSFVFICDDTFTKTQIMRMEIDILQRLDFRIGAPLPITFLRRYQRIAKAPLDHHMLAKYILELGLLDSAYNTFRPSKLAAAACFLAMAILSDTSNPRKLWTPTLVHYSSYEYKDFEDILSRYAVLLVNAEHSKNKATRARYADSKFQRISTHPKLKGLLVRKLAANKK